MSSYPLINDYKSSLTKELQNQPNSVDLEYHCYAAWYLPGLKSVLRSMGYMLSRTDDRGDEKPCLGSKVVHVLLGTHFARMN